MKIEHIEPAGSPIFSDEVMALQREMADGYKLFEGQLLEWPKEQPQPFRGLTQIIFTPVKTDG